jgi:hypothetical protein
MGLLPCILGYLVLCFVAGIVGRERRLGFWGFVFCSIVFTPFLSLMFLYFASAPRRQWISAKK